MRRIAVLTLGIGGSLVVTACAGILGLDATELGDASVGGLDGGADVTGGGHPEAGGADASEASQAVDGVVPEAAPGCATTCSGCCEADGACVLAPVEAGVCGAGGATCSTCTTGAPCQSGICFGCGSAYVLTGGLTADPKVSGFASSVAADGTTLVVGAPTTNGTGAAYVFAQSGAAWTLQSTIYSGAPATNFGAHVAVRGSIAMVSAATGTTSSVYVYNRVGSSWFPGPTITPKTVDAGAANASDVALDGTTVVIGAANLFSDTTVYALSGNTWTSQGSLHAGESASSLFAGERVALSGDTAVVSVSTLDTSGQIARWADVFVRSGTTWTQQTTLAPTTIQANNDPAFQFSVGVSGDLAVLGSSAGAFVYTRTGTTWTAQPTTQDAGIDFAPTPLDNGFGRSLSVGPGGALVGDSVGYGGGASYFFGLGSSGWLEHEMPYFDAGAGSPFIVGQCVARSGSVAAVCAPGGSTQYPSGAVLVYDCSP
jgi:hypothetical protein